VELRKYRLNLEERSRMPRPRTVTKPLDLTKLLDGPRTRLELDATAYAIDLAAAEGVICATEKKQVNATLWKLTRKGRERARRGVGT